MEAGLPNITAAWSHCGFGGTNGAYEGVLYDSKTWAQVNGGFQNILSTFDASRCNPAYGNSETVTPLSESVVFCIKH